MTLDSTTKNLFPSFPSRVILSTTFSQSYSIKMWMAAVRKCQLLRTYSNAKLCYMTQSRIHLMHLYLLIIHINGEIKFYSSSSVHVFVHLIMYLYHSEVSFFFLKLERVGNVTTKASLKFNENIFGLLRLLLNVPIMYN